MFRAIDLSSHAAAKKIPDDIPLNIKKRRLTEIIDKQQEHSLFRAEKFVGKTVEVLIEGISKKSELHFKGRTSQNTVVVFPKENYKSPMQISDKGEKDNFFKQVKKLWKKKKGESKEAGVVQEEFFKRFNQEQMSELASALEITKAHSKITNKVVHTQLLRALNKALDTGSVSKKEEE